MEATILQEAQGLGALLDKMDDNDKYFYAHYVAKHLQLLICK